MGVDPVQLARASIAEDRAVAEVCREWLNTMPDLDATSVHLPGVSPTATAGDEGERTVRIPIRFAAPAQSLVDHLVRFDVERVLLELSAAEVLVEGHEPTEGGACRTCVDPDPSLAQPVPLRHPCPTLRAGLWTWTRQLDYDPARTS